MAETPKHAHPTDRLVEDPEPDYPHTYLTVRQATRALAYLAGLDPEIYAQVVAYGRSAETRRRLGMRPHLTRKDTHHE